jgi:hypothetical protein
VSLLNCMLTPAVCAKVRTDCITKTRKYYQQMNVLKYAVHAFIVMSICKKLQCTPVEGKCYTKDSAASMHATFR